MKFRRLLSSFAVNKTKVVFSFVLSMFLVLLPVKHVFAGMIGTHVGEFDLGSQIHILQMVKSKGVPDGYPVTIVVEMYKSQAEIQQLADASSDLRPVVRIAHIETNTPQSAIVELANNLNAVTWPQGNKPIVVFGNEMNNLDSDREWGGNPPANVALAGRIYGGGKGSNDDDNQLYGLFQIFNTVLDNSYPLAAQPPDMYNGNPLYDWSSFVANAGTAYENASAFVANVYNIEPGKLIRWQSFPGRYQKGTKFFTEYGPSPSESIKVHLEFYKSNPPPDGIDATTLVPNKCDGETSWLWYINGDIYNFDGDKVDPESCALSSGGGLVLRDPATLLAQESFPSAFSSMITNYTVSCAPTFKVKGEVKNEKKEAIIDGAEQTIYDACFGKNSGTCVFDEVSGSLQTQSDAAKVPYHSTDVVSSRASGYDGFYSFKSSKGDIINTAPFYKLSSPVDICNYNLSVLRATKQICETPSAESYRTLVSSQNGGPSVQGVTTDGGGCSINTSIRVSGKSMKMKEIFEKVQKLRDAYPQDGFVTVEDFCDIADMEKGSDAAQKNPTYNEVQELNMYVSKVQPLRNVYEVGYLVYTKDFVPPPKTPLEIIFPFISITTERDEIPIQDITTVLLPYGLNSQKGHDYLTGMLPLTYNIMKQPEQIEEDQKKYQEEIQTLQGSFIEMIPEGEDETTCTDYICCPRCKELLDQYKDSSPGFREDIFKSMVAAMLNKAIASRVTTNNNTVLGSPGENNLNGAYQYCRLSQEEIKGETVKYLGSSVVQSTYEAITNILVSVFGTIRVAGPGAQSSNIRVFLITPDDTRSLRQQEGNLLSAFLPPDYMEYVNKQEEEDPNNPLLQISKNSYSSSSDGQPKDFPKLPDEENPDPSASPNLLRVEALFDIQGDQMTSGAGAIVAGGLHAREVFEMLAHILAPPDGPNYAETYVQTTLEDLWTNKSSGSGI